MTTTLWSAYVAAVAARAGVERQQDIGDRVGVSQAAVSRWVRGLQVPDEPAVVAAFAKAFDRNVLEAFVVAGMLDEDDAGRGLPRSSRTFLAQLREEEEARAQLRAALDSMNLRHKRPHVLPKRGQSGQKP